MTKWRISFEIDVENPDDVFGDFSSLEEAKNYLDNTSRDVIISIHEEWCEENCIDFDKHYDEQLEMEIYELLEFKPDFGVKNLLETIKEQGYEAYGEYADGFLENVKQENLELLQEYLQGAFNSWASVTNNEATFYQLGRVKKYTKV